MLEGSIIKHSLFLLLFNSLACNRVDLPTQSAYNVVIPENIKQPIVPEGNPATLEGIALGRQLFYDKRLSRDNSISCSSCHIQKFAFTDQNKISIGIDSTELTFNSMSLTNVSLSSKLFWDGRGKSLEMQALAPVINHLEMDQRLSATIEKLQNTELYPRLFYKAFGEKTITSRKIAYAISQFERTLISFNSKYDSYIKKESELSEVEIDGMNLFFTTPNPTTGLRGGGCINCHLPQTFAGSRDNFNGFKNNGLNKVHYGIHSQGRQRLSHKNEDYGKFKVPSLRNIEVTFPYMHDGRFSTLEQVLDHYSENIVVSETTDSLLLTLTNDSSSKLIGLHFTPHEKKAIIAFLKTLTDNDFLENSDLADPGLNIDL